jgi:hypothetical protein
MLIALLVALSARAADATLPALRFSSDVVTSSLFDKIQRTPQFQGMSRQALGSPIELRVFHTYRINRGSATASAMMSAATLGLFPQVMSGEHSIVYDVLVNGVVLASYKYSVTLTHARSLWVQDTTHGLGNEGVKWVESTVDLFVKDAANDPKLDALSTEYNYYFAQ